MGNCFSAEDPEAVKRTKEINQYLREESKKAAQTRDVKILLLGAGESGKSTIIKQMKICYLNGYTRDELLAARPLILKNIYDSVFALVEALDQFNYQFDDPKNKEYVEKLQSIEYSAVEADIDDNTGKMIYSIWKDKAIQRAYERNNEFLIMDTAKYFFEEIERIAKIDYLPTQDDILKSRLKTTGISETRFTIDTLSICMYDVGGQRSERKKWVHCFENITSIIFIAAISEYDQVLEEDSDQNRMAESLILFEAIVNSPWFVNSSFILFLNKIDLFAEKIKRIPLSKYFQEYQGGDDYEKATKFMLWRFKQCNQQSLTVYPHLTCATDTNQIKIVFSSVKDTIIQNSLKDLGVM